VKKNRLFVELEYNRSTQKQYQQNIIFLPVLCKNSATQNTVESILTRITFHFLLLDMDFYATLDATK
jgi:hypothetical protein